MTLFKETETHAEGKLVSVELVYRQTAQVASVKDEEFRVHIDTTESPYERIAELEQQLEDEIGMRDVIAHEVVELRQQVEQLRTALEQERERAAGIAESLCICMKPDCDICWIAQKIRGG